MLKKLYKHEIYSLFRSMIAVYIAIIGLALLGKVSFLVQKEHIFSSVLKVSSVALYVMGVVAMLVIGFVIVIVRFYKNLLSKEGYLTFTLPFKPQQHLNCKLLCGVTVIVVNFIVFILSLFIFGVGTDGYKTFCDAVKMGLDMLTQLYKPWQIAIVVAEFILMLIVSLFQTLAMLYAAMAVGQRFKSKIGGAVLSYVIMYSAIETVELVFMIVSMPLGDYLNKIMEKYMYASTVALFGFGIVYSAVITSVMYFIARRQLEKNLNLE